MKIELQSACSQSNLDLLCEASRLASDVPGDIVELGSYKGASAIALAMANPHKRIFACDLFGGNPYPERSQFVHLANVNFCEVFEAVSRHPNISLVKGLHEETVPHLPVKQVSFLFMDSDWYESHVIGLENLAPKIPTGGIIAFHDWSFPMIRLAALESLDEKWDWLGDQFAYKPDTQGMAFLRRVK